MESQIGALVEKLRDAAEALESLGEQELVLPMPSSHPPNFSTHSASEAPPNVGTLATSFIIWRTCWRSRLSRFLPWRPSRAGPLNA